MIKPIGKNILVKAIPMSNISSGGILIPETVETDSDKVLVLATGNKVTKVKEGQTAFRLHQYGTEIIEDGVKYFLIEESGILAISN